MGIIHQFIHIDTHSTPVHDTVAEIQSQGYVTRRGNTILTVTPSM